MKLRTKFVALLVPLVVAPLLFLGNIAYTQLKISATQRMFDDVGARLERVRESVDKTRRVSDASLDMIAAGAPLQDFLAGNGDAALRANLDRLRAANPDIERLLITDAAGVTLGHYDGQSMPGRITDGDRAWFLGRSRAFRATLDEQRERFVLQNALTVRDANDATQAFLVLTRRLDQLALVARNHVMAADGFFLVTNQQGDVLAGDTQLGDSELPQGAEFNTWRALVMDGSYREFPINGAGHYVKGVKLPGELLLYAVLPTSQVNASTRKFAVTMFVITLLAISLTSGTLLLALHHIVVLPIRQIQSAANAIGRGELHVHHLRASNDEIGELAKSFSDMSTNLRDSNDHVQYLAYHDSLTGLPNRSMFRDQLQHAMAQARREHQRIAVLFIDLDDFKRINDTLGHQIGDEILTRFSEAVTRELREGDVISRITDDDSDHMLARLGGDEFIILLRNVADEYAPRNIARRICNLMSQPFAIGSHELYISSSIGISMFPEDAGSADDLIRNADAAMYHAKDQGKNNYQYYSESMNVAAANRLLMETRLRKAIELDQFELYYQPKVDPHSLEIVGAEALLRWNDPDFGLVPPDQFIHIAEESGLIVPIGEWVMNQACIQLADWQRRELPPITLSVNVSPIQVARQDLSFVVARSLRNSNVDARLLDIEITESTLMSGGDRAVRMLSELRGLDVSVSLDDFGTGYSSLSYLRRFPVSNLKIDRSFVAEIEHDEGCRSIVSAIIAMSNSMDMSVTAEGVETEAQLDFLCEHECDSVQGFLISRPVPIADFERLLVATDWRTRREARSGGL
ncbi:MAG: EAL domain-containing protein [Pseudomonadota bacterium]